MRWAAPVAGDGCTNGRVRRHSDHKQRAPFTPGRRKQPCAQPVNRSAVPQDVAAVGSAAARGTAGGWLAVKRAIVYKSCAARLAVPVKLNMDEERVHKTAGSAICSTAASNRWDVQKMYDKLFWASTEPEQVDEEDPWSQDQGIHANDQAAERKTRDRLHVLRTVKRKFKRTLVNLLGADADWEELFHHYDADGSGSIGLGELTACIRYDANVSDEQLSDAELRVLFDFIDTDASGEISAEEFVTFMDTPMAKTRAALPISGNVQRSTPTCASPKASREPAGGSKETVVHQPAAWKKPLPFVAEYMTNARVPLRADCFANSEVIGYLEKGEVVAVTHVWGGNELKCHRLRWYDPRRGMVGSGWASQRGKLRLTDGTSELLSRLSRDEWSARCQHYTSVADRVSALDARARLVQQMPGTRSQTVLPQDNNALEEEENEVDEEVEATTMEQQGHKRTMRVYASIDRALVLHQIAAKKLECRAELELDVHAKHSAAQGPEDAATHAASNPWPAPPSTSRPDAQSRPKWRKGQTTAEPATLNGEASAPSAGPTKISPPDSALLRETTCCTNAPSGLATSKQTKPIAQTVTLAMSEIDTKATFTGVFKLHALPPQPAMLCKHTSGANASCANSLWCKPTPSAPTIARCSSPPPRSTRSRRATVCT